MWCRCVCHVAGQRRTHPPRTHGGGRGTVVGPPLGTRKNTIFSGFLSLNYVIRIFSFEVCFFFSFLLCGRTEKACSIIKSFPASNLNGGSTGEGVGNVGKPPRIPQCLRRPDRLPNLSPVCSWAFCRIAGHYRGKVGIPCAGKSASSPRKSQPRVSATADYAAFTLQDIMGKVFNMCATRHPAETCPDETDSGVDVSYELPLITTSGRPLVIFFK